MKWRRERIQPEKLRLGFKGLYSLLQVTYDLVWCHTKESHVYLTCGRIDHELPVLSNILQGFKDRGSWEVK